MIVEVESDFRETDISCPKCGGMTYTDGKHRPMCGDDSCLEELTDAVIWLHLINAPRPTYGISESDAYRWSAQCLTPLEGQCEVHLQQQVADKIASALMAVCIVEES